MNGELKNASVKEEARRLCKEFLGGPWKEVSQEDFRIFEVRGGFSNTLYRCALPEKDHDEASIKHPKETLMRIYGPIQENPDVVISEVVTFMLLSERKLGPRLYGVFPKGRLEEFIPSRSLCSDDLRKFSPSIAREMAKIHALDLPVRKVPDIFEKYSNKWLLECKEALSTDESDRFFPFTRYEKEIAWCSKQMELIDSPVVFCHNDLQGGNVLLRQDLADNGKPNIMLIDFEFGAYNYRDFDLANHLLEWCFDYDTPVFPHFKMDLQKFPSRDEQIAFCTDYLNQLRSEGVEFERSVKEEAQHIQQNISLFTAACSLLWSLWSIKMTLIGTDVSQEVIADLSHAIIPDQTSSKINGNGTDRPTEDRHWRERKDSTLKAAHKEHYKTRIELFQRFKRLHLELSQEK